MVTKEQIQRINELAKKQKTTGLSNEEKAEQEYLRKLYIESVRENLKSQLDNIKVVSKEEYEKLKKDEGCGCGCGHDHHHSHNEGCNCKEHKH